ncbi:MAG: hypothetical protein C5B58_00920 [Acidobacteria bacterium]|nr:MAG: hypothetical protein C5B58_00920 [Acidobacteriota bacterium]
MQSITPTCLVPVFFDRGKLRPQWGARVLDAAVRSTSGFVRFGSFEVDQRSGELRRQGVKVKLQEQPFLLLQMLLERPGEIVTREELQKRIWPSDTFVDFEQGLNNAAKRLREALSDSADAPCLIETIPRRGYRFIGTIKVRPLDRMRSLAVLPLENLSRDPEQEYFAEGLTEALITMLAKIGELRVVSRTSVMVYKGVRKPLRQIARELDVDAIVEGTVLREGKRVRITVQLIDAPREAHLWAESYERDLRHVLALQVEIAKEVAKEIRVKVTPHERAQIAEAHPVNPEAYEAYLKGRYHWNRRPGEIGLAIKCFEEALAKDAAFAAAYALLAHSLCLLTFYGIVPASNGSAKGKVLAHKAIELDNSLADAHLALARALACDFDFLAAEQEFERSIELNSRHSTAHGDLGLFLGYMGRYEEAYTEVLRAIRLDPHSSIIQSFLGFVYIYGRRYDLAVDQFKKTLELDPNSGAAQNGLGWAYLCKSQYEPAILALQKGCAMWPGSSPIAWLGGTYAVAGFHDEAKKILDQLNELSRQRYVTPYGVARIHMSLGKREEALHWLEKAYEQRAEWMVILKVDQCFDDLRNDPRFQDLLRRMNFASGEPVHAGL